MHFSGLTPGHDKGLTQQVLGKVILPTPDLEQGQCLAVSERKCKVSGPLEGHALPIFAFQGLSICGHRVLLTRHLFLPRPPSGRRRSPWRYFSCYDDTQQIALSPPIPGAPSTVSWLPCLLIHSASQQGAVPQGNRTGAGHFLYSK